MCQTKYLFKEDERLELLHKILHPDYKEQKDKIQVFGPEPSSGKSKQVENSLAWYYLKGINASSLFVKKFNIEGFMTVGNINKLAGKIIAAYVISDQSLENDDNDIKSILSSEEYIIIRSKEGKTKEELKEINRYNLEQQNKFKNYFVLCISHKRYGLLKQGNSSYLKHNDSQRINIIIDEKPNDIIRKVEIEQKDINNFYKLIGSLDENLLKNYVRPAFQYVTDFIFRERARDYSLTLSIFNSSMYNSKDIYDKSNYIKKEVKTKHPDHYELVFNYISKLLNIYFNHGVFEVAKGKINTYDKRYNFWIHPKTIILDANASFDLSYQSNKYYIHPIEITSNYSSFTVCRIKTSTSKTAIRKEMEDTNQTKFEALVESTLNHIKKTHKENDKILIICFMDDIDYVNLCISKSELSNIRIDYFGNLLGKNNYREYNKVYILTTFNYNYVDYILQYLFYGGELEGLIDDDSVEIAKGKFKNEKFQEYRDSIVLGHFYQSILRVDRDLKYNTEIYIFTKEVEIYNRLIKMLPGCKTNDKGAGNLNNTKWDKERDRREEKRKKLVMKLFVKIVKNRGKKYKRKYSKKEIYSLLNEEFQAAATKDTFAFIWQDKDFLDWSYTAGIIIDPTGKKKHIIFCPESQWGKVLRFL